MIYIENITSYSQRIYIPRDEAPTAATTGHTYALQSKDYIINQNGTTKIHPDGGYDGISGGTIGVYVSSATGVTPAHLNVTENGLYVPTGNTMYSGVTVNVDIDGVFDSGYTSGYTEGYASGYTSGSTDGYNSGYTSGETHQRSLLSSTTITANSQTVTSETGWSGVTVDINLGILYAGEVTQNGHYVHSIYDFPEQVRPQGWRQVEFDVNVPQGYSQEEVDLIRELAYNDGYEKGYQDGVESVISGRTYVNVNPKQIRANSGSTSSTINIISNSAWTITASQWITPSVYSGIGDTSVTIAITNNTGITRNGEIIVTDVTTQKTDNVVVIQKGTSDGDYSKQVFTIQITKAIEPGNYLELNFEDKDVYMSINDGLYTKITYENKRIYVGVGDTIKLKGDNASLDCQGVFKNRIGTPNHYYLSYIVYGNIMSLFDSQNFENVYEFENGTTNNLRSFMVASFGLDDASNLILPVTSLTEGCYSNMFGACSYLISAPKLPATTLARSCYAVMFASCNRLINAPELLAENVPDFGFHFMFSNCRSLSYIKCLAKSFSGNYATDDWLQNVAPTGIFVKDPSTSWSRGTDGIPINWSVIDA